MAPNHGIQDFVLAEHAAPPVRPEGEQGPPFGEEEGERDQQGDRERDNLAGGRQGSSSKKTKTEEGREDNGRVFV